LLCQGFLEMRSLQAQYQKEAKLYGAFWLQLFNGKPPAKDAGRPKKKEPVKVEIPSQAPAGYKDTRAKELRRDLPPISGRPIRMLCLHGSASCQGVTQMQMQSFASLAKQKVELVYIDGGFDSRDIGPAGYQTQLSRQQFPQFDKFYDYAWNPTIDGVENADPHLRTYEKLDEGIAHLRKEAAKLGQIDGIWGFAQGATFAHMLAAEGLSGEAPEFKDVRFVIAIAAPDPGYQDHKPCYKAKNKLPTLMCGGGAQDIHGGEVRKWEKLSKFYEGSFFLQHEDGHQPFPRKNPEKQNYTQAMLNFVVEACG